VRLVIRCGECCGETEGDYDPGEVAAFDRSLVEGRLEMRALYQAVLRSNMSDEAERLRVALALDLVSADDFAGYNRGALQWSSSDDS
jgi:hypothetical protein